MDQANKYIEQLKEIYIQFILFVHEAKIVRKKVDGKFVKQIEFKDGCNLNEDFIKQFKNNFEDFDDPCPRSCDCEHKEWLNFHTAIIWALKDRIYCIIDDIDYLFNEIKNYPEERYSENIRRIKNDIIILLPQIELIRYGFHYNITDYGLENTFNNFENIILKLENCFEE